MNAESFLGFYLATQPRFWAKSPIIIHDIFDNNVSKQMGEIVFCYEEQEKFKIMLCRDGMFLLKVKDLDEKINNIRSKAPDFPDFLEGLQLWAKYLKYANVASLLFESAHIEFIKPIPPDKIKESDIICFLTKEITKENAFFINYREREGVFVSATSSCEEVLARYGCYLFKVEPLNVHPFFSKRGIITEQIFDKFSQKFKEAFCNIKLLEYLSLLNKSVAQYKEVDFNRSIVFSWFVVERFVSAEYNKCMGVDGTNNKDNMEKKINKLAEKGIITKEIKEQLHKARDIRNKITHASFFNIEEGKKNAENVLVAAKDIIKEFMGVDIKMRLSIKYYL